MSEAARVRMEMPDIVEPPMKMQYYRSTMANEEKA